MGGAYRTQLVAYPRELPCILGVTGNMLSTQGVLQVGQSTAVSRPESRHTTAGLMDTRLGVPYYGMLVPIVAEEQNSAFPGGEARRALAWGV